MLSPAAGRVPWILFNSIFGALFLCSTVLACSFVLTGCSDRPPIPEKDFVEIYVQLQIFDAKYTNQPKEQKAAIDSLLKAYSVNDSLVMATLSWYGREPRRWHDLFSDVKTRMAQVKSDYIKSKH